MNEASSLWVLLNNRHRIQLETETHQLFSPKVKKQKDNNYNTGGKHKPKPKPKSSNKVHWLEALFKILGRNLKVTDLINS